MVEHGRIQHSLPFLRPTAEPGRTTKLRPRRPVPGSRVSPPRPPGLADFPVTADITRGAELLLQNLGFRTLTEMKLTTGRRVDVIGLDGRGRFAIVEVKSSLADFRADEKWPEYLAFCDWFYFAVAPDFPRDSLPDETGIIIADRFGGEIARTSPDTPMATQARHRQTLLFAHTASARLFRLTESGL